MRNFLIDLNEKYQRNKRKLWFIVAVITLFLVVTRGMDKMANSRGSSNITAASESVSNYVSVDNAIKNATNVEKDDYNLVKENLGNVLIDANGIVKLFVELCNNQKYESAYEMLSEDCKNLLYPTKQEFIDSYINKIFKTRKNYSMERASGATYKVSFKEEEITTGGSTNKVYQEYITCCGGDKINISNLIKTEKVSIKAYNSYVNAEITDKITYAGYVVYKVKIKNIVKADIYLNDTMYNGIYLLDSNGEKINIKTDEYVEGDYLIPSETVKIVSLRFNAPLGKERAIKSMNFDNMKIVNKNYYNDSTGELKTTKYPEKADFKISL